MLDAVTLRKGSSMIVSEIMTTKIVTISPDDTMVHAANLFKQYQFHHLPVVRHVPIHGAKKTVYGTSQTVLELQGLVTSQDIDLAVAESKRSSSGDLLHYSWQEQPVAKVMHHAGLRVTPNTNVAAAAQIMVERGINSLPVVEYEQTEPDRETQTILVGLLTRSDLLLALARSLGAYEPGMQMEIRLPMGDLTPLAQTLTLASRLHVQIRSIMVSPLEGGVPRSASLRLGTINPAPLLRLLKEATIEYSIVDALTEDNVHG